MEPIHVISALTFFIFVCSVGVFLIVKKQLSSTPNLLATESDLFKAIMPDSATALRFMSGAYWRLVELGWEQPISFPPGESSRVWAIEPSHNRPILCKATRGYNPDNLVEDADPQFVTGNCTVRYPLLWRSVTDD